MRTKRLRNTRKDKVDGIEKIYIDLSTNEGESFNLLKVARGLAKKLELNWNPIYEEMTEDDYDHLVEVFQKHFSNFVTIY